MADNEKMIVEIVMDDGSIKRGFISLERQAEKTGSAMGKSMTSAVALGTLAANAISSAISSMKSFGEQSIRSAMGAERSFKSLSNALALNGKYSKEAANGFKNFVDQLERQSGFSSDELIKGASRFATVAGKTGKDLEDATKAAVDLSNATGKDLSFSFRMLERAALGSEVGLNSFGVSIDKSVPSSERLRAILDQIENRFGALTGINLNTFEGSLNAVSLSMDKLQSSLGRLITDSPTIRGIINGISEVLLDLSESLSKNLSGDIFEGFIDSLFGVGRIITGFILPSFETLFNILRTGVLVVATFGSGVQTAFLKIYQTFIEWVATPILRFFGEGLSSVIGVFSKDMASSLKEGVSSLSGFIENSVKEIADNSASMTSVLAGQTAEAATSAFDTRFSDYADAQLEKLQGAVDRAREIGSGGEPVNQEQESSLNKILDGSVLEAFSLAIDGAKEQSDSLASSFQENFKKAGASMFSVLGSGAANAFSAFGKAAASGQNALKAFANAMLATMGQAAVQLGTQFILQGIAMTWAGMSNGPPLIGAGAALAAFGGILSALGGSSGASTNTAPGGGTSTPGSVDVNQPDLIDGKRGPEIKVEIQGSVLDSRETGMRIIEVLRENFDSDDLSLVGT